MPDRTAPQLAKLQRMTTAQLRAKWRRTVGCEPRSSNRAWLIKRLSWAIQAKRYGGLSVRTQRRLEELLVHVDAWMPSAKKVPPAPPPTSGRVSTLAPGTILTRVYKGRTLTVLVRDDGLFEFEDAVYPSLTAVAKAVTGSHWSGNLFFGLRSGRKRS